MPTYNGCALAREGVVLVAVSHRLGVPGFAVLDGAPANLGLRVRDQIAALEWVRRQRGWFAGNPEDVTVFGESAGGVSVATLMACPAARGLFRLTVVHSGGGPASVRCRTPADAAGGSSPVRNTDVRTDIG